MALDTKTQRSCQSHQFPAFKEKEYLVQASSWSPLLSTTLNL